MQYSKPIVFFLLLLLALSPLAFSQSPPRLREAVSKFAADPQLKHASWSLVVADAASGRILFDHNGDMGLAPASTLKVLTSITALELLGPTHRFETKVGYSGVLTAGELTGNLVVQGSGDPSFGSWRYPLSKSEGILEQLKDQIIGKGIRSVKGAILVDSSGWNEASIPDGWIWQDIGNYYGAGSFPLNWHENQYDILLSSGAQPGDPVRIVATSPELQGMELVSMLHSGPKGSGDNAYVYGVPGTSKAVIRGTIPVQESRFSISASMADPGLQFASQLVTGLEQAGIRFSGDGLYRSGANTAPVTPLYVHRSPALDSLVYWFLRKSINLYGEAFLRALAGDPAHATKKGVERLRDFWKQQGIAPEALQVVDGSGLSPQNRITALALVQALQYARKASWYPAFYEALPVYNGMKLKSGTINGAKAYAGYHKAANGKQYSIAILVNNYSGSSAALINKMYKVLDQLK